MLIRAASFGYWFTRWLQLLHLDFLDLCFRSTDVSIRWVICIDLHKLIQCLKESYRILPFIPVVLWRLQLATGQNVLTVLI